jgi:hypothetical protein
LGKEGRVGSVDREMSLLVLRPSRS